MKFVLALEPFIFDFRNLGIHSFKKVQSNLYGFSLCCCFHNDAVNARLCPHCVYVQLLNMNVIYCKVVRLFITCI